MKNTSIGKFFSNLFKRNTPAIEFKNSAQYWEERYQKNKTSGPGSYGRLAEFKAEVLNDFVEQNSIDKVLEFGCGDGNQLQLAEYPTYIGVDVSETAIEICKELFKNDPGKRFYVAQEYKKRNEKAPLVLSLDVLFHLIEDAIFDGYMYHLFDASTKYVIIYSSNYNDHSDIHVKSRKFTDWIDTNLEEDWQLKQFIKNRYPFKKGDTRNTSMADFYMYEKIA